MLINPLRTIFILILLKENLGNDFVDFNPFKGE